MQAAGGLASKRVGGLIIFEGKADLDPFISEGIEMDCALTREALFSLFIPSFENPLHDGAVLIRNYRIYKAAAIIRHLTSRTDLPRDMGTRHRAAIGITEETDAVAIVVSEERGAISVCFRGNIVQSVSMSDLRSLLDARFKRSTGIGTGAKSLGGLVRPKKRSKISPQAKEEEKGAQPAGSGASEGSRPPALPVKEVLPEEKKGSADERRETSLEDPEVFAQFLGTK